MPICRWFGLALVGLAWIGLALVGLEGPAEYCPDPSSCPPDPLRRGGAHLPWPAVQPLEDRPEPRLRPASIVAGAAYALVISGAAGVGQAVVDREGWRGLLFLVVVFGFVFGGFVAGRGNFGNAARHGAVAAVAAFLLLQGVASVRRLVVGQPVSVVGLLFNGFTAAVCGSLGGLLATRSPGPDAVRGRRTRGANSN